MGNFISNIFEGNNKYYTLLIIGFIFYLITHTISLSYFIKYGENTLLKDQKELKNATITSLVFSIIFLIFNSFLLIKNRSNLFLYETDLLYKIAKWISNLSLIIIPLVFIMNDVIIINSINKEGDLKGRQYLVISNVVFTIILFVAILTLKINKQIIINKDLCRNYEIDLGYLTENLKEKE